jgi:Nucleotidyltransferase domain
LVVKIAEITGEIAAPASAATLLVPRLATRMVPDDRSADGQREPARAERVRHMRSAPSVDALYVLRQADRLNPWGPGTPRLTAVTDVPPAVTQLADRLADAGWVLDLFVAGSLAMGDYVPGVSDVDLVALVDGPLDEPRLATLTELHQNLDRGAAAGLDLGCVYVNARRLYDSDALHATWTHGSLVHRILSGVTRAELVRHGFALIGRPPAAVLPDVSDDDVRRAARAELCGYWAWASRRPLMWLNPVIADLGLTSMARGRYALETGRLLTKSRAIEQAHAPAWLRRELAARRRGETVVSPRVRTALIAWRDARRTVARADRAATDG